MQDHKWIFELPEFLYSNFRISFVFVSIDMIFTNYIIQRYLWWRWRLQYPLRLVFVPQQNNLNQNISTNTNTGIAVNSQISFIKTNITNPLNWLQHMKVIKESGHPTNLSYSSGKRKLGNNSVILELQPGIKSALFNFYFLSFSLVILSRSRCRDFWISSTGYGQVAVTSGLSCSQPTIKIDSTRHCYGRGAWMCTSICLTAPLVVLEPWLPTTLV